MSRPPDGAGAWRGTIGSARIRRQTPLGRITAVIVGTWLSRLKAGVTIVVLCEDIPPGIQPENNEMGSRSTLQNLAAFVE